MAPCWPCRTGSRRVPRVCTACASPKRHEIDRALLNREGFAAIARESGVSEDAVKRHKDGGHVIQAIAPAPAAVQVAQAEDLLAQVRALRSKAMGLLIKAEAAGDYRTALAGVKEARACLELLLEVEGELDRRPNVQVLVAAPAWIAMRTAIKAALARHPHARADVADAIRALVPGS